MGSQGSQQISKTCRVPYRSLAENIKRKARPPRIYAFPLSPEVTIAENQLQLHNLLGDIRKPTSFHQTRKPNELFLFAS